MIRVFDPSAELREQSQTLRQQILAELVQSAATARDLSGRLGIPEKEVIPHLEHLQQSLRHSKEKFVVEPAVCLCCGYVFKDRKRLSKPSACPNCRKQHIEPPVFRVQSD
jgi:transcriptional regulator